MPDIRDQYHGIGGRYVMDAAGNRVPVDEYPEPSDGVTDTTDTTEAATASVVKPSAKHTTAPKTDA